MKICDKFKFNSIFIHGIHPVSAEFECAPPVIINSSVRWGNGWKPWGHVGFLGENWEILGYFEISNNNVANGNRIYFQDGFYN